MPILEYDNHRFRFGIEDVYAEDGVFVGYLPWFSASLGVPNELANTELDKSASFLVPGEALVDRESTIRRAILTLKLNWDRQKANVAFAVGAKVGHKSTAREGKVCVGPGYQPLGHTFVEFDNVVEEINDLELLLLP